METRLKAGRFWKNGRWSSTKRRGYYGAQEEPREEVAHTKTPAAAVKGDRLGTIEQAEATNDIVAAGRAPAPTPTKEEAQTPTNEEAAAAPGDPKHLLKEATETGPSRSAMKKPRI